jgi:hypothetical protein
MRKYENVDITATLGAVAAINTDHYRNDFKYDAMAFRKAAKRPDGENNFFLWLSRKCGTECLPEREVYLIESWAHDIWHYHANVLNEGSLP